MLEKNVATNHKNAFGRDDVYLVSSFNEWMPILMRTAYEIKTAKKMDEDDLIKLLKDPEKRYSQKKPADNQISYTNYIPPGRHYFYYIQKNDHIFLSPKYDIVRFKGSNVFLNTVRISERTKDLV